MEVENLNLSCVEVIEQCLRSIEQYWFSICYISLNPFVILIKLLNLYVLCFKYIDYG